MITTSQTAATAVLDLGYPASGGATVPALVAHGQRSRHPLAGKAYSEVIGGGI